MEVPKKQTLSVLFFNNLQNKNDDSSGTQTTPFQTPPDGSVGHLPGLGSIRADQDLSGCLEHPEYGFQTTLVELGVRIVQEIDRFPLGALEKPPASRSQKQTQSLPLSRRSDPSNTSTAEQNLDIVQVGADQRPTLVSLATLETAHLVEHGLLRDLLAFDRRSVSKLYRRQRESAQRDCLGELSRHPLYVVATKPHDLARRGCQNLVPRPDCPSPFQQKDPFRSERLSVPGQGL